MLMSIQEIVLSDYLYEEKRVKQFKPTEINERYQTDTVKHSKDLNIN